MRKADSILATGRDIPYLILKVEENVQECL